VSNIRSALFSLPSFFLFSDCFFPSEASHDFLTVNNVLLNNDQVVTLTGKVQVCVNLPLSLGGTNAVKVSPEKGGTRIHPSMEKEREKERKRERERKREEKREGKRERGRERERESL